MTIETKELVISGYLKKKVDMKCRFANFKYEMINGNVINLKFRRIFKKKTLV